MNDEQLVEESKQDAITEYIHSVETMSPDQTGTHIIPYGSAYIILETRKNNPHRYIGWCVATRSLDELPNIWKHVGSYGPDWDKQKWQVWRLKKDFKND